MNNLYYCACMRTCSRAAEFVPKLMLDKKITFMPLTMPFAIRLIDMCIVT